MYERSIQDLEREARDLERRIAKVRSVIVGLREIVAEEKRGGPRSAAPREEAAPLRLEIEATDEPIHKKGDTTRLILDTLKAKPGLTSSQLGDLLKDEVTSKAKSPRRLILNAVGYLYSKDRVRKNAAGGWEIVPEEAAPR